MPTPFYWAGMQRRSQNATNADLDVMKAHGAQLVRLTFDFSINANAGNAGNPINGLTGGTALTRALYAKSIGLNVLICATYCPSWLAAYHQIPGSSGGRDDWAEIFAELVDLYDVAHGGPVDYWELWNEPNHEPFNATPVMSSIRDLMRKAILAARANVPGAFIFPGGPASALSRTAVNNPKWDDGTRTPNAGDLSISPATYLDGLYDAGGLDAGTTVGTAWASALAIHGYTAPPAGQGPDYNIFENEWWHAFRDMPNVGRTSDFGSAGFNYYDDILRVREPGTTKRIWQTEGGLHGGWGGLSEGDAFNHQLIKCAAWKGWQDDGKAGPDINFELYDNKTSNADGPTPTMPYSLGTKQSGSGTEDGLGMFYTTTAGGHVPKSQLAAWDAFALATVEDPTSPHLPYAPVKIPGQGTPRAKRPKTPARRYRRPPKQY